MREHYMRIERSEARHKHPQCGCALVRAEDGSVVLYLCRPHAAARELLAGAEFALGVMERRANVETMADGNGSWSHYIAPLKAAIARARGRKGSTR